MPQAPPPSLALKAAALKACHTASSLSRRISHSLPPSTTTTTTTARSSATMAASVAAAPEQLSSVKHFGGFNKRYKHHSEACGCDMTFTIFFPPAPPANISSTVIKPPVLYYLSGLTCTDENFIQKSGAQGPAAAHGVALVAPDTSPRGLGVEGEDESWDFGAGAGFYLNATQPKWKNWRMYDYVRKELPALLRTHFSDQLDVNTASIMGHSMGGHGALVLALRNPDVYKSVSAFSPICNPVNVPWGVKAFTGYLGGEDKEAWKQYDAVELIKAAGSNTPKLPLLVDTGTADPFLDKQLQPETLQAALLEAGLSANVRLQEGYDHSYFFIATFVAEHVAFHAKALKDI